MVFWFVFVMPQSGSTTHRFGGFSPSEASLIQNWVSAEVWADSQLEDAMNIDRRTLREVHPAYVELRQAVHSKLREVLGNARSRLYEVGSEERRISKVRVARRELAALTSELPASVRQKTGAVLSPTGKGRAAVDTALLKRYSVVEIYGAVIDVAREMLSPAQMVEFLRRLAVRLRRR